MDNNCSEMVERRKGFIYYTEECGCKSKAKISYVLNKKYTEKQLCNRHLKSVTSWLQRIGVDYKVC